MILLKEGALIDYILIAHRDMEDPPSFGVKYVPNKKSDFYSAEMQKKTMRTRNQDILAHIPQNMQRKQFMENIAYVKGYEDESGKALSVENFYDMAPAADVQELIRAMEDGTKMSEGDRKNLSRVSGTASSTEAPSPAKNVQTEN